MMQKLQKKWKLPWKEPPSNVLHRMQEKAAAMKEKSLPLALGDQLLQGPLDSRSPGWDLLP